MMCVCVFVCVCASLIPCSHNPEVPQPDPRAFCGMNAALGMGGGWAI